MPSISEVESAIQQHLMRQIDIYSLALPVAEQLSVQYDAGPEQQQELARLEEYMREAFQENQQMTGKMAGIADLRELSPDIKTKSARLTDDISRMMELFDAIENRARDVKRKLSPELDESLKVRKMQTAYSRHRS